MKKRSLYYGVLLAIISMGLSAFGGQLVTDDLDVFGTASFYGDVNIGWGTPTNDLILYYDFNTNSSTATDLSSSGYDGTVTGATWTNDGVNGGCFYFDGTDDYVSAGDVLNLSETMTTMTICAWIKLPAADTSWPHFVSKQQQPSPYTGYALSMHSDQTSFVQVKKNSTDYAEIKGTTGISTGEWHFLCTTFEITPSSLSVFLYLDGVLEGSDTDSGSYTTVSNAAAFTIGSRDAGGTSDFTGFIDEVLVYSRVLTANEIGSLYASSRGSEGSLNVKGLIVDNEIVQTGNGTNILMGSTGIGVTNPVGQLHVGGLVNVEGNIRLNDNYLSGDGDDEGISVASDGTVTILKLEPQGDIEMGSYTNSP